MSELNAVLDELASAALIDGADWADVKRRARAPRARRTALTAAVLALAVGVIVSPAVGVDRLTGLFGGESVAPERLPPDTLRFLSAMSAGERPDAPASVEEQLAHARAAELRRIAIRGERAFYVADRRGGGLCVAIGREDDPRLFGSILCSPDFPSPERPLLDRSDFSGPITSPRVSRLEGFAADGVASVGVVTRDDQVVALTPVEGNVYLRTSDLPDTPVVGFVALDAAGAVVKKECFLPSTAC